MSNIDDILTKEIHVKCDNWRLKSLSCMFYPELDKFICYQVTHNKHLKCLSRSTVAFPQSVMENFLSFNFGHLNYIQ